MNIDHRTTTGSVNPNSQTQGSQIQQQKHYHVYQDYQHEHFTKICAKQNFDIHYRQSCNNNNSITILRITDYNSIPYRCYEYKIFALSQLDQLNKYFDQVQQFIQHIRDPSLFVIQSPQSQQSQKNTKTDTDIHRYNTHNSRSNRIESGLNMKILYSIRKDKHIDIAVLNFIHVYTDNIDIKIINKQYIQQAVQIINNSNNINSLHASDYKQSITILTTSIQYLLAQSQSHSHILSSYSHTSNNTIDNTNNNGSKLKLQVNTATVTQKNISQCIKQSQQKILSLLKQYSSYVDDRLDANLNSINKAQKQIKVINQKIQKMAIDIDNNRKNIQNHDSTIGVIKINVSGIIQRQRQRQRQKQIQMQKYKQIYKDKSSQILKQANNIDLQAKIKQGVQNYGKLQTSKVYQIIANYSDNFMKVQQRKSINQTINKLQQKLTVLEKETFTKLNNIVSSINSVRQKIFTRQPIVAINWVDPDCYHFGDAAYNRSEITALKENIRLFSSPLLKQKCQFSLILHKIKNNIAVGVIGQHHRGKAHSSSLRQYNHVYYSSDGICWNGLNLMIKNTNKINSNNKQTENGFKQGQTVTVHVDFILGEIQWKVAQTVRLSLTVMDLKDRGVIWVPYLMMQDKDDKVSILP